MNELDDRIRDHYARRQLPAAKRHHMTAVAGRRSRRAIGIRWGAGLCTGAVMLALWLDVGRVSDRVTHAVRDAAMNHGAALTLEYATDSVVELNERMGRLPFDVVLPERLASGFSVQGARYCSISGHLAVHLRLIDDHSDRKVSLFMTSLFEELEAIDDRLDRADGVAVELWQEGDLFYVLAATS